ncbi:MAG: tetratricopeptide repeat protein [Aeromonadaceae bacterium]|nr:tetratricopeptide repeat protein [Aeromonadaceae bacterium]
MEIYNNEEQQAEAIKSWIKENGRAVVLGAAIGLVGMFGWRYYNDYHQGKMEAASAAYDVVIKDLDQNKEKAFSTVSEFVSNYSGSAQGDLAALQLASAAVKAGKLDLAVSQLQTVADKGNAAVKPIAAIRLARVLGEQGKFADAQKRLDSVTQKAYKAVVAEVRGDLYLQQNDKSKALAAYQEAVAAGGEQSSSELRSKLDDLGATTAPVAKEKSNA